MIVGDLRLDCYHLTFLTVVYKEFPLVYTGYLLPFIQTNYSSKEYFTVVLKDFIYTGFLLILDSYLLQLTLVLSIWWIY